MRQALQEKRQDLHRWGKKRIESEEERRRGMWGWEGWITGKAKLLSQLGSDLGGILLIGINQVGAEGAILPSPRRISIIFINLLFGSSKRPSLLGCRLVVEGRSPFGVDLPEAKRCCTTTR